MPQDPNLYGQRAPKRHKKETALPSSLAFSAELSSLISTSKSSNSSSNSKKASSSFAPPTESGASIPSTSTSSARPRPSKSKPDIFANVRAVKRKPERNSSSSSNNELVLKEVHGTHDEKMQLAAARRKMEEKARLYAAMKRGDYVPDASSSSSSAAAAAASLVDFDKKWAEKHADHDGSGSSSSSDDDDDDDDDDENDIDTTEIIEYTDEFGRTRRGPRADALRLERRLRARAHGAAELARMSARPQVSTPAHLIRGDAIQADAFRPVDEAAMDALARKRDRSLTPPEARHYEADREIRTKGVGFFQFSKDEEARAREMGALEAERANTERERAGREEEKRRREEEREARRRVIEERRREVGEKRAKRMADSFLDGLAADLGSGTAPEENKGG